MRICLISHGFPPYERTGVEQYTAALAAEFARAGHTVEVFAPRRDEQLPDHSLRREERTVGGPNRGPGGKGAQASYGVNWIALNRNPSGPLDMLEVPAVARVFGQLLDRERPEVCHFQHVVKLGIGLIEEARKRKIPTIYTAHDYYAVCHRYTLLRPDLSHCDVRGDSMACAHCDLALGHLNAQPGLGDYQIGVFPDQLEAPEWQKLQSILGDDAEAAGIGLEEIDDALDLRRDLDARRARAFDAIDRIIAPTNFLSNELVQGGVDPRKLEVLSYGIDISDLQGLDPVRADKAKEPLRFAFVGGISKHKGIHLLLDAWRILKRENKKKNEAPRAELSVWGYSTDAVFHQRVRNEAASLGIHWRGPYERRDLPEVLETIDVVISPSTWVENYPIVIREAFAAGRPVIASRFGAIPESIRDGVDGLLFGHNDAEDLARVLARCLNEPGLVGKLVSGVPDVHDIETQAGELLERYDALVTTHAEARRESAASVLPPSLEAFEARHKEISQMPTRQLMKRALVKLAELRAGLGCDSLGLTDLLYEVGEGLRTQDWMRDARQEIDWLRGKLREEGEVRDQLEETVGLLERDLLATNEGNVRQVEHLRSAEDYVREKETALVEAEGRLGEAESFIHAKESDLDVAEGQLEEAARYVAQKEEEVRNAQAELERLREYAAEKESAIQSIESALGEASAYARTKEVELSQTEERLGEAGQHIEHQEETLEATRLELERAALHIRKQEAAITGSEEALREADVRMRNQERSIGQSQGRLVQARDDLQRAAVELQEAKTERDVARAATEAREGELEERESTIEEKDTLIQRREHELQRTVAEAVEGSERLRSAAELGLVAIDTQRRLLSQVLLPLYQKISLAAAPGQDPELPHPDSSFGHLVSALRDLTDKTTNLFEELDWRRNLTERMEKELVWSRQHIGNQFAELKWRRVEMDKVLSTMERLVLARIVALAKNRKRVLGWKEELERFTYEDSYEPDDPEPKKPEQNEPEQNESGASEAAGGETPQ